MVVVGGARRRDREGGGLRTPNPETCQHSSITVRELITPVGLGVRRVETTFECSECLFVFELRPCNEQNPKLALLVALHQNAKLEADLAREVANGDKVERLLRDCEVNAEALRSRITQLESERSRDALDGQAALDEANGRIRNLTSRLAAFPCDAGERP